MAQKNLLTPPSNLPPPAVLALSQKAPRILAKSPTSSLPWPVNLLFSTETPESWTIHENLFLSSLRAGDDASARKVLDRLTSRFGEKNERIVTLRGIYEESQATSPAELDKVFDGYEKILREDPTNVSIRKRRVVILKNLGRINDAITAITTLLQHSPTDTEAWAEASELYAMQGAWGQAIFCMEEVLLAMPNAWSAHAQLATLHYLSSASSPNVPSLALALRSFSRSVELNESYLRGYYGLKFVTKKLIPLLETAASSSSRKGNADDDDVPVPQLATVKKLEEIATTKLAEIVRNYSTGKKGWTAFDEAEVIAARELLDRDSKVER